MNYKIVYDAKNISGQVTTTEIAAGTTKKNANEVLAEYLEDAYKNNGLAFIFDIDGNKINEGALGGTFCCKIYNEGNFVNKAKANHSAVEKILLNNKFAKEPVNLAEEIDCDNKIAVLRKTAGLTQKQLSEKTGIHLMTISKIERGVAEIENITLGNAVKIADALGVHTEELIK